MRPGVALMMIALAAELLLAGCATNKTTLPGYITPPLPAAPKAALTIEQVAVEPKTLDLTKQTEVSLRYSLPRPSTVSIELFDEDGQLVRQLALGRQEAGAQTARWDGRDGEGNPVPSGVYRYVIRAHGQEGQEWVYDPSQELGGEEIEPRDFQWDPQSGRFRWVMPKAGHARLRIGMEGFPHLRTLLDWEPMEAGEQSLSWDGMDASGLIRLRDHPQLAIKLAAFALAPNTIILRGQNPGTLHVPPKKNVRMLPVERPLYLHAGHPRSTCREVGLRIEFPQARSDAEGRPILRGKVPIRIALDPADTTRMINERFELAVFEDLTVIFEEEEALNPFTFEWDTGRLTPGQHLLTVNLLGHDDHFGVETQAVWIEAAS